MKILHIHIENVASLVEADIDFERGPLADDPIFLISGQTGSGKSTILNCICLALYNECPPLDDNNRNDRDCDNLPLTNTALLIRKGAARAEVRLDFIANDSRRYTAFWSQRRIKTRTGRDGRPPALKYELTRTLLDTSANITETLTTDIAERLTGLTYEQFTRTTLLAQGHFSEFLKAPGPEKAKMLEKITGTGIYSRIGEAIAAEYKEINDRLTIAKAALGGIRLLSDEEAASHNTRFAALKEAIEKSTVDAATAKTRLDWLTSLSKLRKLLDGHRAEAERLEGEGKSEEFAKARENVAMFDSTASVRASLTALEAETRSLENHKAAMEKLVSSHLPGLLGAVEELGMKEACDIKNAVDFALKATEKAGATAGEAATAEEAVGFARNSVEKLAEEKDRLDLNALNEAADRPSEALRHITAAEEAKKAIGKAEGEAGELKGECERLQLIISRAKAKAAKSAEERGPLEERLKIQKNICDALSSIEDRIDEMRSALTTTDKCPLCGTNHVTFVGEEVFSANVARARRMRDEAKTALDDCYRRKNEAESEIRATQPILRSAEARHKAKVQAIAESREKFEKEFADVPLSDASALAALTEKLEKELADARKALSEADSLIRRESSARELLHKAETALAEAVEASRLRDKMREQLRPFSIAHPEIAPGKSTGIGDPASAVSQFLARVAAAEALAAESKGRAEKLGTEVNAWLSLHAGFRREMLGALTAAAGEVEESRKRIKDHDDALIAARAAVETVASQLAAHLEARPEMPEEATEESLAAETALLAARIDEDKAESARITATLEADARNRAEWLEKMAEIDMLAKDTALWKKLNDLLGTSSARFRNVAQSYVLRTLLSKANGYLRTFSRRYSLTARPGTLTVSVIDGELPGSPRAASSLSGGETFIVSLALALALASVSKEKINVDTLFIDEGFGSLDSESLSMIIDALDTLHTIGGRRIGIISHMDILKERIPTQIRLRKLGGNVSKLEVVVCNS